MKNQKNKTSKYNSGVIYILIILLYILVISTIYTTRQTVDVGAYDYCIEWNNPEGGIIQRDNMLYNCYSLSTQEFKCDYKIYQNGKLMIKPIKNATKDKEGFITEIIYDKPKYYNCSRWLKSKKLK